MAGMTSDAPHICQCPGAPHKTPRDEAAGLIALLGWDPWDFLDAIEVESDDTLHAVLDILRPESPDEPERIKMLSRLGTRAVLRVLHERALEFGRLADDGCMGAA